MSRFDGPRQGLATWLIGLIVTVVLLAAIAGGKQGTHFHRKIDKTGGIER